MDLIKRHQSGDWGNVPPGDAEENLRSVENGCRVLSSYAISDDQNLWIITEADRSVTMLLLPEVTLHGRPHSAKHSFSDFEKV